MSQPSLFAAQILENSAPAYAGYAASLLLERHREVTERYGSAALRDWKASLTQRVLELAAALDAEEPRIFTSRVLWVAKLLRARDLAARDLRSALACLREVLRDELPEVGRDEADRYLGLALEALDAAPPAAEAGLDPSKPIDRLALRYVQAVLEGDGRAGLDLVVGAVDEGMGLERVYLGVLLGAQREVGNMWHAGELSVAEEHVVTATTERAMSILAQRARRRESNGKTVLAAAVGGNRHGLGARVLADFFEVAGWRSICLGADVPAADVALAVVYFDADVLVLSAALATQLKSVRRTIETVRALPEREVKILVGGGAFADTPDLWRRLGADGHAAGANSAVSLAGRLVGLEVAGD